MPFVDLMKQSRPWSSIQDGNWGQGNLSLTPQGWVASLASNQSAASILITDGGFPDGYPAGNYTLLYDGIGDFTQSGATIVSQAPGKIVFALNGHDGFTLRETSTDSGNPAVNLRFLMPGHETDYAANPFNPTFLSLIAPFSTIRYMDWTNTNDNTVVDWADRSISGYTEFHIHDDAGVAIEYQIMLANQLHANPWFNIPTRASDDYVQHEAQLIHDTLDPTLHPYIEYSNEAWNGGFPVYAYLQPLSQQDNLPHEQEYAKRATQIFAIFNTAFGADQSRIVKVAGTQLAYGDAYLSQSILQWTSTQDKAVQPNVLAVAPYYGDAQRQDGDAASGEIAGQSVAQAIAAMDQEATGQASAIVKCITDNKKVADQYGIPLVAYEGGVDTGSTSYAQQEVITTLFSNAMKDPAMKGVTLDFLNMWKANGGTLLNYYNDVSSQNSMYGDWGSVSSVYADRSTQPKYQGLLEFINNNKQ